MNKKKIFKWLEDIQSMCFVCADDPKDFGYKEYDYIDTRIGRIRKELGGD